MKQTQSFVSPFDPFEVPCDLHGLLLGSFFVVLLCSGLFSTSPRAPREPTKQMPLPRLHQPSGTTAAAPHEAVDVVEEEVSKPAPKDAVKEKAKIEEPAVQKAVHKGSDEKENHEANDGDSPRSKLWLL